MRNVIFAVASFLVATTVALTAVADTQSDATSIYNAVNQMGISISCDKENPKLTMGAKYHENGLIGLYAGGTINGKAGFASFLHADNDGKPEMVDIVGKHMTSDEVHAFIVSEIMQCMMRTS